MEGNLDLMEIGSVVLRRGEKAKGSLAIETEALDSAIQLPVLTVSGEVDGPTLVVSGAVHGDEYEGPRAIQLMWQELDPAELKGTFIGVPVVNVPAFMDGRRESPIDGLNMNRICPGSPHGSVSERIAHGFHQEVVRHADYYVDLHAGGNGFSMLPTVVFLESGSEEFVQRELALAKAAGVDLLWKGTGVWSASHVAAVRRGIPAILIELGEEGRCKQERLDLGLRSIRNVLIHAGMLAGSPMLPPSWTVVAGTYMVSPATGCFYATASAGDHVREGGIVGTIVDLWGDVIENVKAPSDGVIVSTRTFPLLHAGARTTFVGRILDTLGAEHNVIAGDAATRLWEQR